MADVAGGAVDLEGTHQLMEANAVAIIGIAQEVGSGGGGGGGSSLTYVNRVWDATAGSLVRWNTTTNPDPSGSSYPGPGTFGVDTSDYCIETILD